MTLAKTKSLVLIGFLLTVLLPSCAGEEIASPGMETPVPTFPLTSSPTPSRTRTSTATHTAIPSPTPTVPDYPSVTLPAPDRLREIFAAGDRQGRRKGVFSKVGDSLTANKVFLVPIGSGKYRLGEYAYLQDAVDYFSTENARAGNSFANVSLAAVGGWHAADVLNPARVGPPCEPGESPLVCEYRLVRPSISIILLGTNDVLLQSGNFREDLNEIVWRTLERGILPILTTLPPMTGRNVKPFNSAILDLAQIRDLPLIDLYTALLPLPNHGLWPDGVHLSWDDPADFSPANLKYGMAVRNLLTLQALDAVWRSTDPPGDDP